MQGGILLVGTHDFAKVDFGFAELLLADFGGGFQQGWRNGGPDPGGLERFRN